MIGKKIHKLCKVLLPINRSLTGNGNRKTLKILKKYCPKLKIKEIPTGTKIFDWTIPKEWNVKEAWIKGPDNKKFADYSKNNLHLVGYSQKIKKKLSLKKLEKNFYYLKKLPSRNNVFLPISKIIIFCNNCIVVSNMQIFVQF